MARDPPRDGRQDDRLRPRRRDADRGRGRAAPRLDRAGPRGARPGGRGCPEPNGAQRAEAGARRRAPRSRRSTVARSTRRSAPMLPAGLSTRVSDDSRPDQPSASSRTARRSCAHQHRGAAAHGPRPGPAARERRQPAQPHRPPDREGGRARPRAGAGRDRGRAGGGRPARRRAGEAGREAPSRRSRCSTPASTRAAAAASAESGGEAPAGAPNRRLRAAPGARGGAPSRLWTPPGRSDGRPARLRAASAAGVATAGRFARSQPANRGTRA